MFRVSMALAAGVLVGGQWMGARLTRDASGVLPDARWEAAERPVRRAGAFREATAAPDGQRPVQNIPQLLAAVHGLPGVVCGLTAQAAAGWGGNSWMNAPAPPLGPDATERVAGFPRGSLTLSEVSLVLDSLGSTDACVRELSVRLVGRVHAELVERRLLERLATTQPATTREATVLSLGLVRSKEATGPLMRLVTDEEIGVRANAVWALGRIGERRAAAAVRRTLADDAALVRGAAAGTLGALEDTASIDELVRVLRTDREARVRRTAAWAIGTMEQRRASGALASALGAEREETVREMIVWALGTLEAADGVPALLTVLRRDPSADVREGAAWALGQIEDEAAAEALGSAVGSDEDADVRASAAWALGQLEVRPAPEGLIRAVSDKDVDVRTRAAWALSEIGEARAVAPLRAALRTETDRRARRAQIRALLHAGERSESFFKELLTSDDADVREAAVAGMAGRRGMDPWPWPQPRPRPFP
jgi:HEAT repeat protein